MNPADGGQQPAMEPLPPAKKFPLVPVIITAVGLLLVLAVLGGIKAFQAAQEGSAQAIVVGNSFIDNMGAHNCAAAHALLTPPMQKDTPAGTLADLETLVEKHHGAFVNHGKPQWNMQTFNGQTTVRLAYPAQFTKSNTTVSMTLVPTSSGYQVSGAHYDF